MDNPTTLTAPTSGPSDVPEKAGEAPQLEPGCYTMFTTTAAPPDSAAAKAAEQQEANYHASLARLRAAQDAPAPKRSKSGADKEKARGDGKAQEGGAPQPGARSPAEAGSQSPEGGEGSSESAEDGEEDDDEPRWEDVMEQAAYKGDLNKLVGLLNVYPFWDHPFDDFADRMHWIRIGLEVAAREDPEKLVTFLAGRVLAFEGWALLRAQYVVQRETMLHDKVMHRPQGDLPPHIETEWIPRVARIQEGIIRTASVFASIRHTLELGKGKKRRSKSPTAGGEQDEPK